MKVEELIAQLEKQPADMEVLVQSYEEGFDPVTDVRPMAVSEKPDKPWYVGVYEEDARSGKIMLSIESRHNRADKADKKEV